jgi:two-component system sensor histidine kinase HydH
VDIRSQSALLAAIVTLALAISMLLRPRRRVLFLFSLLCLSLFGYYLGEFLSAVSTAQVWPRTKIVFGSLVPATTLAFFMEFLKVSPRSAKRARAGALVGVLGGLVVGVSPLADSQIAKTIVSVWIFGLLAASLSLLVRTMASTESRTERARLFYLAVGAGTTIGASALDCLPHFGIGFPPLGAIIATLYMFLLAQTLQRLRLLDLHELLGKAAGLSLQAIIFVAIYALLVSWASTTFSLFLFNTMVASIVVLILFEPLRAKVDEWVVATLFRERFEMIRTLSGLKARLANVIEVAEMAKLVLDTFDETRRVTHSSIYLLSDDRPGFWLLESRGPAPVRFLDAAAVRGLVGVTQAGQKAVLLENLERRLQDLRTSDQPDRRRAREETKRLTELKNTLRQMNAGITVPLMGGDRIIGFLNLWDERVPEAYASDEIALILEIAERAAIVVENSKLYERVKERDRLAALGEMAAGLAHEIRNPLGAIKGAAQFLSPQNLPAETTEFLGIIVEEVDRLNAVVTQFLDYSRPLKQNFTPTDVADVVNRTLKLLSNSIPPAVTVALKSAERLPKIQGDPEQLKQVLINLFQNSVQAMPGGGTLTIEVHAPSDMTAWRLSGAPELLEVRVRDTGHGLSEEARQHIFVPFYTTKEKGTGLGLAICQRIIKNHGGSISLSNQREEGTEFVIRLPAIPEPRTEPAVEGTPSPDETPSPDGTPSPELTPYPANYSELSLLPRHREKKRKRA